MTDILLIDIGGTHARLANWTEQGAYSNFQKYRLNDYGAFSEIIDSYIAQTGKSYVGARFSAARTPVDGAISYKRFAGDPDYEINFRKLSTQFAWDDVSVLNDLEAAAHGLGVLENEKLTLVSGPKPQSVRQDDYVLISVGTGVGHAYCRGGKIFGTHGGHFLPVLSSSEHQAFADYIVAQKNDGLSLIMEDFVSSRGLVMLAEYVTGKKFDGAFDADLLGALRTHSDIVRLFFEFLGLHAHIICSVTGIYGGVYLAGGVMDNLVKSGTTDWTAFESFLVNKMVSVVEKDLASVPAFYVIEEELPLLGLTVIGGAE